MDLLPFQDVYANLLAEGIAGVIARAKGVGGSSIVDDHSNEVSDEAQAVFHKLLAAASTTRMDPALGGEALRDFLLSPEARDIATGICVSEIVGSNGDLEDRLRRRFLATLSWYSGVPEATLQVSSDRFFDLLRDAAHEVLGSALQADDDFRALVVKRVLTDARGVADRNLSLFTRQRVPHFADTFEFEAQFRQSMAARHDRIEPPNYDGISTIPLDSLYVEPRFRLGKGGDYVSADKISQDFQRTVVLGNPGAGKSSFARSLCHRLAHHPSGDRSDPTSAVPFLVELREYGAQRRQGVSVLDYLEQTASGIYQASVPDHAVEYLLLSGRAVVIFDGLDELLDTRDRGEIRADVEAFSQRFPFTRILVTSREVGYSDAPLDDRRFEVVHIDDFSEDQVTEYVERWFGLDTSLAADERTALANAFLSESSSVSDLRSNALLLALMCSIYKRQRYIPRNRAGVYEECAEMLFERWDKSRQIYAGQPIETHLRPLLQHIARWVFEDASRQAGVTHSEIVRHTEMYILEEVIDDVQEAQRAANQFVAFCHGRGWVLVATGSTPDGQDLYGFVHRTFLEFFTAGWYASNSDSPQILADQLLAHVEVGEWDVVTLLAIQLRNEAVRGSGNEILRALLDRLAGSSASKVRYLLDLASRALAEFLVPKPEITRALAGAAIKAHLESVTGLQGEDENALEGWTITESTIANLLKAEVDTERPIREALVGCLVDAIESNDDALALVAADCALNLRLVEFGGRDPVVKRTAAIRDEVWKVCQERLKVLATHDLSCANSLRQSGFISMEAMIESHSPLVLWASIKHPGFPSVTSVPYAEWLLALAVARVYDSGLSVDKLAEQLDLVGRLLMGADRGWIGRPIPSSGHVSPPDRLVSGPPANGREPLSLKGVSPAGRVALATTVLVLLSDGGQQVRSQLKQSGSPVDVYLADVLGGDEALGLDEPMMDFVQEVRRCYQSD